jgi:hypothetical protein
MNAAPDLDSARQALAAFWSANKALQEAAATRQEGLTPGALRVAAGGPRGTALFDRLPVGDPGAAAATLARRASMIDFLVLAILLAVALVAGMQALWVDKTFGGFWDIAAAFAWGLGSGAVAGPLTAALGSASRSWLTAHEDAA